MRITDVEPGFIFEGENPQYAQLTQLLQTAREPWERNQIKWRIENLRSSEALAGEPGGGNGAPLDSQGNYIPVLPTKEWMAKNPSIVKTLPNDCLPPNMQKPGVLDKISNAIGKGADAVFNWADKQPNSRTNLERDKQQNRDNANGVMREGADQDLGNGFTLTTTEFEGKTVPAVLDTQDKIYWIENNTGSRNYGMSSYIKIQNGKADGGRPGNQTLAAIKAAGWNVPETRQREPRPEPAPSAPFVPKDYQTGEPLTKGQDGKWYNKAGQERDNLHGGPIMPGGTAQFRSLKENSELTRIKDITSRVLKG